MPCQYYSDSEYREMDRQALDRLSRLLCKMVAHFGVIPGDAELQRWKTNHDEMDRRREAAEKVAADQKVEDDRIREIAKTAESKLTAEELSALRRR